VVQSFNSGERVAIALGSNLGDSRSIIRSTLHTLAETSRIALKAYSHYYQTKAVGPPQPDYLNVCALLSTELDPQTLMHTLLDIEARFGRVRRERWGPRLLDLDLLLFDGLIINQPELQIPHPRMHVRAFVLAPLAEIAPNWIEPISGEAIATLLQKVDCSGVRKMNFELEMF
jgi:2-amino-4-hydroxy-6-hydroxymethyldihydropteridine diphosphokinase